MLRKLKDVVGLALDIALFIGREARELLRR
jgi:hypothetical protein